MKSARPIILTRVIALVLALTVCVQVGAVRYQCGDFVYDCNYVMGHCEATLMRYAGTDTDVTIPETVEYQGNTYPIIYIGDEFSSPFALNATVRSVSLPANAQQVGTEAFFGCQQLRSVDLGAGLTDIGAYAFADCPQLEQVTIRPKLTAIGAYAFAHCTSLSTITLGRTVQRIGAYALDGTPLTSLIVLRTEPALCDGPLSSTNLYSNCTLYVHIGSRGAFMATGSEWSRFENIVERPEPGDLNQDGATDISDVNLLINVLLGREYLEQSVGDLDHNGTIDIADINIVLNLLLGRIEN